jgi:formate dehydrogenase iron-sulfur subunit
METAIPGTPFPATVATPEPPANETIEPALGEEVNPPGAFPPEPMGFYTDTTVCIGCKACEVACKNWNGLSSTNGGANVLSGDSYDNTRRLDGQHWRHVKFIEQFDEDRTDGRWLMMSDVCKHCVHAGCLEVCPTNAIIRTEYDTVVIQADVCNGCRDCIAACPFGVIDINPVNNTAMKCTLCYDRMSAGLVPACAQACPTASIQFGPIAELRERGAARVEQLNAANRDAGKPEDAYLYGADDSIVGGLNSFYLLVDEPEVYGLPRAPKLPSENLPATGALTALGAAAMGVLGLVGFRKYRMDGFAEEARQQGDTEIVIAPGEETRVVRHEGDGTEEARGG